ncbi:MAG: hypothetical protein AAFX40_01985 [Cyanobacteria bacterium J06639_1]
MPTIEMISIGASWPLQLPSYSGFAYQSEREIVSHRSLFQSILDELEGVIVHLANKNLEKHRGFWFTGRLMDWEQEDNVMRFKQDVLPQVVSLMHQLIQYSPTSDLIFLTDYQFGGQRQVIESLMSASEFLRLHDENQLNFNTLYRIQNLN